MTSPSLPPPPGSRSSLPPPPPLPPGGYAYPADRSYGTAWWGLWDAVLAVVVFLSVSIVLGIVVFAATGDDSFSGPLLPLVLGVPPTVMMAFTFWVGRHKGRGAAADFGFRFKPVDLGWGLGLGMAGIIVAGIVGVLMTELTGDEPNATAAEIAEESAGGDGITLWLIVFAVLGATLIPVAEELVFRGLWWSALEKRGVSPAWTLVLTSALFSIIHIEPERVIILFVLGIALGLGRTITGRIGPAIVGHVMINAIGMTALLAEIA